MEDKLTPPEEATEKQETPEPVVNEVTPPTNVHFDDSLKSSKKIPIIIAIVLAVIVLGAGLYWFILKDESTDQPSNDSQNNSAQTEQEVKTTPTATDTKKYTSAVEGLNLSFDYPTNWQVAVLDDTKDSKVKYIQVSTTNFSLTSSDGEAVTGKAIITIRTKGSEIPELSTGNATVAQDSQQIGYKKPSASQRQYPFVSFVHLTDNQFSNNPFEHVIITGGRQYKKSEIMTSAKVREVDPLISFTIYKCKSDACTGADMTALSITDDTWKNNQNLQQVKTLLESLVIN